MVVCVRECVSIRCMCLCVTGTKNACVCVCVSVGKGGASCLFTFSQVVVVEGSTTVHLTCSQYSLAYTSSATQQVTTVCTHSSLMIVCSPASVTLASSHLYHRVPILTCAIQCTPSIDAPVCVNTAYRSYIRPVQVGDAESTSAGKPTSGQLMYDISFRVPASLVRCMMRMGGRIPE
jgi:hypothetical protein